MAKAELHPAAKLAFDRQGPGDLAAPVKELRARADEAGRPAPEVVLMTALPLEDPQRAADSVGEGREDSDDSDPSYERDSYRLSVDHSPRPRIGRITCSSRPAGPRVDENAPSPSGPRSSEPCWNRPSDWPAWVP